MIMSGLRLLYYTDSKISLPKIYFSKIYTNIDDLKDVITH